MTVYKVHHQDCSSQQEAAGCINDAISIQADPVQSVKRMHSVFQTGLSQLQGVP